MIDILRKLFGKKSDKIVSDLPKVTQNKISYILKN